ncbi:MAG: hypothetical protein PUD07_01585 [bacterium]|nr:hypothetical protein [bacterium]
MRKYYVFNVNKEMSILAKDSPYMLYKSFETIYNSNKKEINIAQNLYEQLAMRLNQNVINQKIYAEYKDNDYYYLVNNSHNYYNKYKGEEEKVIVKNTYLYCTSNTTNLKLLKPLTNYNFFVCDFENKDYFWIDEIYSR